MVITPMKKADLESVARLAGQLGYPSGAADVERRYSEIRANPEHAVFVARDEAGAVIGWIHVHKHVSLASDARAEVSGLVVDASHRGRGIGTELLAEAERWSRAQGLPDLRFTSNVTREEAHKLYLRLGYEIRKTSHVFTKPLNPS